MEDILLACQKEIISHLASLSKGRLFIDLPGIYTKSKHISIQDRIPPKKVDLIFLQGKDTDEKKAQKYLSKFGMVLCVFSPSEAFIAKGKEYPHIFLSTTDSPVYRQLVSFLSLTKKYTETTKEQKHVIDYVHSHILELGLIQVTQKEKDAEIAIFFAAEDDSIAFQTYLSSATSPEAISTFYAKTLEHLAQGIDKRNIRFQKNTTFLFSSLQQFVTRTGRGIGTRVQSITRAVAKASQTTKKHIQTVTANQQNNIHNRQIRRKKEQKEEKKQRKIQLPLPKAPSLSLSWNKLVLEHIKNTIGKIQINMYLRQHIATIKQTSYDEFLQRQRTNAVNNLSKRRQLQKQKEQPKISILMVVDDIDEIWLNKSVRSIKDQTYKNWELIIIDNCSPRTYLKSYLSSLNDPRTRTHFYNTKKTLAECLATGVKIAKGDYISILEQGDELDIETLFYIAQQINQDMNVEIIYTDEDKINEQGRRVQPFFKPGWDPVMILSFPYPHHFLVLKRELVERIEAFKTYNVQDPVWDVLLKARQATSNIAHIPRLLYHHRIRPIRKQETVYHPDALKNFMSHETIQGTIKPSVYPHAFYILRKNIDVENVSIMTWDNKTENVTQFIHHLPFKNKHIPIHVLSSEPLHIEKTDNIHLHQFPVWNFATMVNTITEGVTTDFVLLMDTRVRAINPDFLSILLSYGQEDTIVGTKIVDPDNIIQNSFYIPHIRGMVSSMHEGMMDSGQFETSVTRECMAVSRKLMLIPTKLLKETPLFSGYMRNYHDIDFCLQVQTLKGGKIIFAPDAKAEITHAYAKEIFNEKDSILFMQRWKDTLERVRRHENVEVLLSVKA